MNKIRLFSTNNPEVRNFKYLESSASILGVERRNGFHSLYVSEFIQLHRPRCIVTHLSPDAPIFLKSESSLQESWKSFVKSRNGQFLVRPRPRYFGDITLTEEPLRFLFQTVLSSPHDFYTSSTLFYTNREDSRSFLTKETEKAPDALHLPLLWSYNNFDVTDCLVVGALPELIYREQIVRSIDVYSMRDIFNNYLIHIDSEDFNPRYINKDLFFNRKSDYLAEVIRQALMTYGNIVVLVENEYLESLEKAWRNVQLPVKSLGEFLEIPSIDKSTPIVDHVEKHVLVELMLGKFLVPYFLDHKVYPYSAWGHLGTEEKMYVHCLTAWSYFFDKHYKRFSEETRAVRRGRKSKSKKN